MLDYDLEAGRYDETRGGLPRAEAAARAVLDLVPASGTLLDLACGTGLVTRELAGHGLRVLGVDASAGMARIAAGRVRVVLGDGRRLPIRDRSVDAVTTIWLLHLLDDARPVLAEAARVLRPGECSSRPLTSGPRTGTRAPGSPPTGPSSSSPSWPGTGCGRPGSRGSSATGRAVRAVPTRCSACCRSLHSEPGFAS
ncbi:class I SAM-dependent methyltransferase [Nonomuraea rubra]|uniref:class I SAM-dependent methyltransferase n=1 Tax=Nonomuraea rubra TaxID=46180 RepID=UPI003618E45E